MTENFQKLPNIQYGSTISISHFKDENAFVYADGHVKTNVMLKSFSMFKSFEQMHDKARKKRENNE